MCHRAIQGTVPSSSSMAGRAFLVTTTGTGTIYTTDTIIAFVAPPFGHNYSVATGRGNRRLRIRSAVAFFLFNFDNGVDLFIKGPIRFCPGPECCSDFYEVFPRWEFPWPL